MMILTHYWLVNTSTRETLEPALVYDTTKPMRWHAKVIPVRACTDWRGCPDWSPYAIHGHQGQSGPTLETNASTTVTMSILHWLKYKRWERTGQPSYMMQAQIITKN